MAQARRQGQVPILALLGAVIFLAAVLYLLLEDPGRSTFDPVGKPTIEEEDRPAPVDLQGPEAGAVAQEPGRSEVVPAAGESTLGGAVRGRVLNPDGQPVAGARVILVEKVANVFGSAMLRERGVERLQVETGSAGGFVFRGLSADKSYDMWLHHPDYVLTLGVPVVPVPGESQNLGDLYLDAGREISGIVTDRNGNPIPKARLEARVQQNTVRWLDEETARQEDLELGRLVLGTAGEDGRFRLAPLPEGIWTLTVTAEGFGAAQVTPIVLTGDSEASRRSEQVVELGEEHFLRGIVRDEEGQAIAGASVTVGRVRPRPPVQLATTTAEDGTFELRGLPDGRYGVFVRAEGFSNANRNGVKVDGDPLQITMYRKGGVRGRVTDLQGNPVQKFRLELKKVNKGTAMYGPMGVSRTYDTPDGSYTLENLDPGTYVLLCQAEGFAPTYSPGFKLERDLVTGVDIRLSRGATLSGMVVSLNDGAPVAGAEVILRGIDYEKGKAFLSFMGSDLSDPNNVPRQAVRTDRHGRFVLEHAFVGYAQYQGRSDVKVEVRHPDYLSEFVPVTLQDGVEVEIGPIQLRRGATIQGVALDTEGQPLAGGTVYLNRAPEPGSGYISMNAVLDSQGRFRFSGLEAGQYDLSPVAADQTGVLLFDLERGKEQVFVREGEVREVTLRLPPPE